MTYYIPNYTPAVAFRIQLQSLASRVLCCVMCYRESVEVTEVITESRCWGADWTSDRILPPARLLFYLPEDSLNADLYVCNNCPFLVAQVIEAQQQDGNLFRDEKRAWQTAEVMQLLSPAPSHSLTHSLSLSIRLILSESHTEHRTKLKSCQCRD